MVCPFPLQEPPLKGQLVIIMVLNQVDAPGWIPSAPKQSWAGCGWC